MNLNEAIDLLKKNKYLVELTTLPKIYTDEYGIYAKMTKKGREKRNAKNTYKDDQRYNDHEGTLWLDVKQKDRFTLSLAVISGLVDSGKIDCFNDGIEHYPGGDELTMEDIFNLDIIEDEAQLLDELSYFPSLEDLIYEICGFLEDKMGKKHLRVYRGLELNSYKLAQLYKKDKYVFQSPTRLVQYLDNTTKEFNSFSIDSEIALNFTDGADNYIIFSGEIDNNDVNWAFSAYLMGRHGTTVEAELNLNNLKHLKNIKINDLNITDSVKKEAKLYAKHPDLIHVEKLPTEADYFLIGSNNFTGYFLVNGDCKKILDKPVKKTDLNAGIARGYIIVTFADNTFCLISQKTGKILFKNGCDEILRVYEKKIYVKNGDSYYTFDENEHLLYKTSVFIELANESVTIDGNKVEMVRVYPNTMIVHHRVKSGGPLYNAMFKDGTFMFPKCFVLYDELQDAIQEKIK